jgi:hypothetical protein
MASIADLAREHTDNATQAALDNHEVGLVTLVVLVRTGKRDLATYQAPCRPSSRGEVLAKYGVNINAPLRSPRHAYAWVDTDGRLNVGGTSEMGKRRLRDMYDAIVMSGEDLQLF